MKKALVVQGGGFRTGYTAGILDAFMFLDYNPFDIIVGVSGGAIASSYYLSGQYGCCVEAMKHLAEDPEFVRLSRVMSSDGYMNMDQLRLVAEEIIPFDLENGMSALTNKEAYFVAMNRLTGKSEYLAPKKSDWIDIVIASSTMPFVTKGVQKVRGLELMDGGWSDPIPVKWAADQDVSEIVVIRTASKDLKVSQSWPDYLGSVYFRNNPILRDCFSHNHLAYNRSIDFLNAEHENLSIQQVWPEEPLKCSTHNYSVPDIMTDYRYGLHCGIEFVKKQSI